MKLIESDWLMENCNGFIMNGPMKYFLNIVWKYGLFTVIRIMYDGTKDGKIYSYSMG